MAVGQAPDGLRTKVRSDGTASGRGGAIENLGERRAPFREAHLTLARDAVARGEILMGGAFAEPVDGAMLIFDVHDRTVVEEFVKKDPYVAAGLVRQWRIRPWTVVIGGKS